jgi:preprotein translocase SecE subunit
VARDRKRAKQRRARRGTPAAGRAPERAEAGPPSQPARADVPGALDHASGEVDEFDAALVRGAGGVAATPEAGLEPGDGDDRSEMGGTAAEGGGQVQEETLSAGGADGGGGGLGGDGGAGGGDRDRPSGAPLRGGNRALAFLRASWAELQRVQWPDRRQVTQATAVVLGFVTVAGLYLGAADYLAKEIVELVLA